MLPPLSFHFPTIYYLFIRLDISVTVCVFLHICTVTDFFAEDKLAVSNFFSWWFIGVQGRQYPIFVHFAPQKPEIGRIGERAGHAHLHVNIYRRDALT